jgi:hypothetical protein
MEQILKFPKINERYILINSNLRQEAERASSISKMPISEHVKTSCFFSAMTIRWLISDYEWIQIDNLNGDEMIYQVIFGEDIIDDQHYITVFNGCDVYQSYWKQYSLTKTSHPNILDILSNINSSNETVCMNDWLKLTRVDNPSCTKYKCFYFRPQNQYDSASLLRRLSYISLG